MILILRREGSHLNPGSALEIMLELKRILIPVVDHDFTNNQILNLKNIHSSGVAYLLWYSQLKLSQKTMKIFAKLWQLKLCTYKEMSFQRLKFS